MQTGGKRRHDRKFSNTKCVFISCGHGRTLVPCFTENTQLKVDFVGPTRFRNIKFEATKILFPIRITNLKRTKRQLNKHFLLTSTQLLADLPTASRTLVAF